MTQTLARPQPTTAVRPLPRTLGWLMLAGAAVWCATPTVALPLAAWVGPIAMLRFVRQQPARRGFVLGTAVSALATWGAARAAWPLPSPIAEVAIVLAAMLWQLIYLLDRQFAPRLPARVRSLVLPAAAVGVDMLLAQMYTGTILSPANTQVPFGALMQLTALAGIWPITFLLYWLAPLANNALDRLPARRALLPLAAFAALVVGIVGIGALRLAQVPPTSSVPVAGIALGQMPILRAVAGAAGLDTNLPDDISLSDPRLQATQAALVAFYQHPDAPEWQPVRAALVQMQDELLARTSAEARTGARIIGWGEANALVLHTDEAAFVERARAIARQEGIYLVMNMAVLQPGELRIDNKALIIDQHGDVAATYRKNKLPPGDPSIVGDGTIPVVDTPYGRLAAVICYDLDSPVFIAQLGRQQVDIVVAGAGDWQAIARWHARAATVRGIENGFALLRPANNGLSLASDAQGRIIATADFYAGQRILRTTLPIPTR